MPNICLLSLWIPRSVHSRVDFVCGSLCYLNQTVYWVSQARAHTNTHFQQTWGKHFVFLIILYKKSISTDMLMLNIIITCIKHSFDVFYIALLRLSLRIQSFNGNFYMKRLLKNILCCLHINYFFLCWITNMFKDFITYWVALKQYVCLFLGIEISFHDCVSINW